MWRAGRDPGSAARQRAAPPPSFRPQNLYYGHSFNHTRAVAGPHALIWSRPVDSYPLLLNISAFLTFSPRYVMFSGPSWLAPRVVRRALCSARPHPSAGWVGDQDPSFAGLKDALINILESA